MTEQVEQVEQVIKSVLVVDQDPQILQVLDFIFREHGFTPYLASTAAQAIQQCKTHSPPVGLIDADALALFGPAFLSDLRSLVPSIHFCLVTAGIGTLTEDLALLGIVHVFPKPFAIPELIESVERCL